MKAAFAFGLLLLLSVCGYAQPATVAGGGFVSPVPIPAAPGEILTIHLAGLDAPNQLVSAGSVPLPFTMAGISVTMIEGSATIPVPIIAVFPENTCLNVQATGCTHFVGITLQVPYELVPDRPFLALPPVYAQLAIKQGTHTAVVDLNPVPDSVHILRSGDSIMQPGLQTTGAGLALPLVTHADGSRVLQQSPALPGETLVMYAVGLGATSAKTTTGDKSPPAATVVGPITIGFAFQASPGSSPPTAMPLFAGLTPGFVGLYQINFVVPQPPPSLQLCTPGGPGSNLTVTLYAPSSLDAAGICVQPQVPLE